MKNTSIAGFVYLLIGLVVANNRGYLLGLADIGNLLSALLAIIAWPLLLIGVNLRIAL